MQVPGKVNAISLDSCTKTGVVFTDLISSCEAVNCSRLQLQCTGAVSTLAIEKTDGVQLYLPEAVGGAIHIVHTIVCIHRLLDRVHSCSVCAVSTLAVEKTDGCSCTCQRQWVVLFMHIFNALSGGCIYHNFWTS